MLRPTDIEKIGCKESRYAIVVGVAKRARTIAEEAEDTNTILLEKPVSMAIDDFASGDYKILMPASQNKAPDDSAPEASAAE